MRQFEVVKPEFRKHPNVELKAPKRATKCSAGYDLYSPIDVQIAPQTSKLIWTDFKAQFNPNEVMFLVVTSGMGKKGVMLANTIGVIDSDYYGNESTDGNLGINLYNYGTNPYVIQAGDKIGQAIFTNFLTVDNEEEITTVRTGGFGSTNSNK